MMKRREIGLAALLSAEAFGGQMSASMLRAGPAGAGWTRSQGNRHPLRVAGDCRPCSGREGGGA